MRLSADVGLCLTVVAMVSRLPSLVSADTCRQGPGATSHCSLPNQLGNFQGYYRCANAVKVGKPFDKEELAAMVAWYPHVKGSGIGHSWWGNQFCSGTDSDSINIVTTELNTTLEVILNPVLHNASILPSANFPIKVNETSKTVSVAAGIPQRILLNYLSNYTSPIAPWGYTIPAFPFYIDQTIAGAVSTGTHGSSFLHGSVSSQTVRLELALANGTLLNFTQASNPALWKAVQISVGRLGVITEVELAIMPQDMVARTTDDISFWDFVKILKDLSEEYRAAKNGTSDKTVAEVLAAFEGTQAFWFVPTNTTSLILHKTLEAQAERAFATEAQPIVIEPANLDNARTSASTTLPLSYAVSPQISHAPGPYMNNVDAQVPTPALGPVLMPATDPLAWNSIYYTFLTDFLTNGTFLRRDSIVAETEVVNRATSDTDPYDQYEFSVTLEDIGNCIDEIADIMYSEDLLLGFPVPPLIRFVGQEEAYLSNTNGAPRIFFNIEDHQSYQTGHPNHRFDKIVRVLRGAKCRARMHWGKAGWEKWANCFDGSVEYPETWCHFGCAVQALDPHGKFNSTSTIWEWRATKDGQSVAFGNCCGANGFEPSCTCAPRNDCTYISPYE